MKNGSDRFIRVYKEGTSLTSMGLRQVIVDRETGVNYLMVTGSSDVAVIPLIDADGKPLVTKMGK